MRVFIKVTLFISVIFLTLFSCSNIFHRSNDDSDDQGTERYGSLIVTAAGGPAAKTIAPSGAYAKSQCASYWVEFTGHATEDDFNVDPYIEGEAIYPVALGAWHINMHGRDSSGNPVALGKTENNSDIVIAEGTNAVTVYLDGIDNGTVDGILDYTVTFPPDLVDDVTITLDELPIDGTEITLVSGADPYWEDIDYNNDFASTGTLTIHEPFPSRDYYMKIVFEKDVPELGSTGIYPPLMEIVRICQYLTTSATLELTIADFTQPPADPADFTATAISPTEIGLAWTDMSVLEEGFELETSPNGTDSWSDVTTVDAGFTSYNHTELTAGTAYFYRIRSKNAFGVSDWVEANATTPTPVTGVTLNKDSTTIVHGYTEQLAATVEPVDATDQTVSWESDNESAATVDAGGLVTAVANGSATITVTTTDGGFTDTCDVTVADVWTVSQSGSIDTAGSDITYTNNLVDFSFKVKACPGANFYTGTDDSGESTVGAFWMGETEATNELVATACQWAYDEGKLTGGTVSESTVELFGQELFDLDAGYIQISFSGGTFSVDTGFEDYPCVDMTWYGAVLLCNWLTEMVNGNADEVVYSGMDADWTDDETVENASKTGFRLPSSDEWECAARYIEDANIDGDIKDAGEYYPGDYASGADADYLATTGASDYDGDGDTDYSPDVAWYNVNSDITPNSGFAGSSGTHPVGTAGNGEGEGTPLTGNANKLGIYDMSGNVGEWCFTEDGSYRVRRTGCYVHDVQFMQVGHSYSNDPQGSYDASGFRLCW